MKEGRPKRRMVNRNRRERERLCECDGKIVNILNGKKTKRTEAKWIIIHQRRRYINELMNIYIFKKFILHYIKLILYNIILIIELKF